MDKTALIQQKLQLESRLRNSTSWFYWIAGLSLINTIVVLTGGSINFIFGLGVTQIIDSIAYYISMDRGIVIKYIAVAIDVFIACMFVLIGRSAAKRSRIAFIVGMILYAVDGLLFLIWADYLSIGFHVFALYSIYTGIAAVKKLPDVDRQLEELAEEERIRSIVETKPEEVKDKDEN